MWCGGINARRLSGGSWGRRAGGCRGWGKVALVVFVASRTPPLPHPAEGGKSESQSHQKFAGPKATGCERTFHFSCLRPPLTPPHGGGPKIGEPKSLKIDFL